MTSRTPQGAVGATVLAARRKLAGIATDATARFSESSQRAIDAGRKAARTHRDFGERVRQVDGRVRETAGNRATEPRPRAPAQVRPPSGDAEDRVPADALIPPTEGRESAPSPSSSDRWQVRAGRFGRQQQGERVTPEEPKTPVPAVEDVRLASDALIPPTEDRESAPSPSSSDRWQVRAGRFGRGKQAAPMPSASSTSLGRRDRARPARDDDYFDNDGWLS